MAKAVKDLQRLVTRSQGWAGGVNQRDALPQIQADEAKVMENGVLDQRGAFAKRLGCDFRGTFGGSTERCLALYTFYRANISAPQMLMQTNAGKLYYTSDTTANPIVWTQIATGLSVTAVFSFETFNSAVYMGNGVDDFRKWDGGTLTSFPTAPKGAYLRLWKDTLFISGVLSLPDRVYESAEGNAENWPVANWIDIGRGDGDVHTALGTDGTNLIVWKRDRHWVIYDPVSLANRLVDGEKGCESHHSVVEFESEIFFLSRRGICRFFGDSPSSIISTKVDPLFDPTVINLSTLTKIDAYTVGNQVGWAIPEVGSTTPSVQLEYYPRLTTVVQGVRGQGPFVFHRMPVDVFARVRVGASDRLFGPKSGTNRFLELFSGAVGIDDGVPFAAILETGALDVGQPTRTKYIRRFRFYGRGQVQVTLKRNLTSGSYKSFILQMGSLADVWDAINDHWNVGSWGPDEIMKEVVINPDAYGRYFQLRFVDAMTAMGRRQLNVGSKEYILVAGGWALHQFTIDADLLGVRD
jgi:hypothetical protein